MEAGKAAVLTLYEEWLTSRTAGGIMISDKLNRKENSYEQ